MLEEDLVVGDEAKAEFNSSRPSIFFALTSIDPNRLNLVKEKFQCFFRIDVALSILVGNLVPVLIDDVLDVTRQSFASFEDSKNFTLLIFIENGNVVFKTGKLYSYSNS